MNDIVERLRLAEASAITIMPAVYRQVPPGWCREAADEIERLRAALSDVSLQAEIDMPSFLRLKIISRIARAALGEQG
jgi:hypothetical protein